METVIFNTTNPKINPELLQEEFDNSGLPLAENGSVTIYGYKLPDRTREVGRATESRVLSTRNGVTTMSAEPGEAHVVATRVLTRQEHDEVQKLLDEHVPTLRSTRQVEFDQSKQDKIDLLVLRDSGMDLTSADMKKLLRWTLHRN